MSLLFLPIGSIVSYSGDIAPTSTGLVVFEYFLLCNGAAVDRTAYEALFKRIDVAYGVGNGSTTFNLPDLRGRFIRGYDNGASRDSDTSRIGNSIANLNSVQTDRTKYPTLGFTVSTHTLGNHTHNQVKDGVAQNVDHLPLTPSGYGYWFGNTGTPGSTINTSSASSHSHSYGSGGDPETRPINMNLHYLIRF